MPPSNDNPMSPGNLARLKQARLTALGVCDYYEAEVAKVSRHLDRLRSEQHDAITTYEGLAEQVRLEQVRGENERVEATAGVQSLRRAG
jgi:hypothetical protein